MTVISAMGGEYSKDLRVNFPGLLGNGLITFRAEPNSAYYIGDYISESICGGVHINRLESLSNNYDKTTNIFRANYPKFSGKTFNALK